MTRRLPRHAADAAALGLILLLTCVFYWPRTDPRTSRYVYFADVFERARPAFSGQTDPGFHRSSWEAYSPLACLLARGSVRACGGDPASAVLLMHMGTVFLAAAGTLGALRLFLRLPSALLVATLLLFGRTLLPTARGMGLTQVLLLIPLSLLVLRAWETVTDAQARPGRRWAFVMVGAAALALVYGLGCHETFYAAAVLAGGLVVAAGTWAATCIRRRRLALAGAGRVAAMLLLGGAMGVGIMAGTHAGVPDDDQREPLGDMLRYTTLREGVEKDARDEAGLWESRMKAWQGTFVAGEYLTPHGNHHENAFLIPGWGFNGIVPLFLLPGLAMGLWSLTRRGAVGGGSGRGRGERHLRVFLLLLGLLLVAAMAFGADPKPTRYSFAILAVLIVAARGYEWLYRKAASRFGAAPIGPGAGETTGRAGRPWRALCLVVLPVALLAAGRLGKNYVDLQSYLREYAHQIPSTVLGPMLDRAGAEAGLVAVHCDVPQYARHPAVGLYVGFRLPANVRQTHSQPMLRLLPPGTPVHRARGIPPRDLYPLRRSRWPRRVDGK